MMPEILTESFCERCGTRYTFEAAAPKTKRLGKLKVLSKGFVNYVTNDDSTLDEAFADARSDELRSVTTQQLDAFHKTFQFCMSCRQYTCAKCWNGIEGRCLSCAPHLGREVLEAPFPDLEPLAGLASATAVQYGNGADLAPAFDAAAWPTTDLPARDEEAITVAEPAVEPEAVAETVAEPALEPEAVAEPAVEPEALAEQGVEPEAVAEPAGELVDEDVAQAVADAERARTAAAAAAALAATRKLDEEHADRAAAAAARTSDLLARFRPRHPAEGQRATEAPSEPQPPPAEPQPAAAEPQPAAASAVPDSPPPATRPEDRVETPVWRIVAPDAETPHAPPAATPPVPPAERPAPQWPSPATTPPPQWPMPAAGAAPQWPARPGTGVADLWVASSQDVLSRPGSGVQACVSCGLPLSATARFCRRCGTAQQHG